MQLGWVDFSKEDRAKALDVIGLLQEQGAVDEIGIGIVRDAFANYFFPGTSTIQTRAKYFLIVPYILRETIYNAHNKDVNRILRKVDEEERQCAITLMENCPGADGIIGKRVLPKSWVSRKPSDIYWNGIRTYGIFRDKSLSIAEYIRTSVMLDSQKTIKRSGNRGDDVNDSDRDDKDAEDLTSISFWELPVCSDGWKEELSIDLSEDEAIFLKTQIIRNTRGSLLEYILKNHVDVDKYEGFEALTLGVQQEVPKELQYMMKLACNFNKLVYMARVRYNILLSESKNEVAVSEREWIKEELVGRLNVDLEAVFDQLQIVNPKTFHFLSLLQMYFQNKDIDAADELIKKREINLKGINRAKLNKAGEYGSDIWVGGGWLDYRFSDAKRIIDDIYHGEVASHV
jgi:hypothetical protein